MCVCDCVCVYVSVCGENPKRVQVFRNGSGAPSTIKSAGRCGVVNQSGWKEDRMLTEGPGSFTTTVTIQTNHLNSDIPNKSS